MVLPVEFKPPTMYSTQPNVRTRDRGAGARTTTETICWGRTERSMTKLLSCKDKLSRRTLTSPSCNFHPSSHRGDPKEHCTVEYYAGSYVKTQHVYHKD
ncbi:hypothetical protein PABG_11416 [Paracoccidioides brasiliensis Pb03]|nr:hypothetical protein PABG_11416 [Paracoccidioides brasiliensis Pb03]